jgi:hypothetical protein
MVFRFCFPLDKAAQALPGVARKVGLADLPIVDDIQAASQLFFNHFGNRLAHPLRKSHLSDGLAADFCCMHLF